MTRREIKPIHGPRRLGIVRTCSHDTCDRSSRRASALNPQALGLPGRSLVRQPAGSRRRLTFETLVPFHA